MAFDLKVPEDDEVVVRGKGGEVLFKASVVTIDFLLAEAQRPFLESEDEESIRLGRWLDRFIDLIEKEYGCRLSRSAAFFLAQRCAEMLEELKKNCGYS